MAFPNNIKAQNRSRWFLPLTCNQNLFRTRADPVLLVCRVKSTAASVLSVIAAPALRECSCSLQAHSPYAATHKQAPKSSDSEPLPACVLPFACFRAATADSSRGRTSSVGQPSIVVYLAVIGERFNTVPWNFHILSQNQALSDIIYLFRLKETEIIKAYCLMSDITFNHCSSFKIIYFSLNSLDIRVT